MKYSNATELWTNPVGGMAQEYRHISYALFRTDSDEWMIVGARCPDMLRLAVGSSLPEAIGLDEEARRFLREESGLPKRLFVMTDMGVGILDKRYDRQAGLGLFCHIHGRPDSIARILNHGVLGDVESEEYEISQAIRAVSGEVTPQDMASYEAWMDAMQALMAYPVGTYIPVNENGELYGTDLRDRMLKMAEFVGCGLRFPEQGIPRSVKCYRPLLLEALLLYWLTEARMASATREATCQISTLEGEETRSFSMVFRYPIEKSLPKSDLYRRLEEIHRHVSWVCELGGLILQTEQNTPTRREKQQGKHLPEFCVIAEWQYDPTVLSTTDLKAKIRLLYEEEKK